MGERGACSDAALGLERKRLEYAREMYAIEVSRRELLEKRAQLLMGLAGLLFAAASLQDEPLSALGEAVALALSGQQYVKALLVLLLVVALSSLASFMIALAAIYFPRKGERPYPRRVVSRLFAPDDSEEVKQEENLTRQWAMRTAMAVEFNIKRNNGMARTLLVASISLALLIFSYAALVFVLQIAPKL